MALRSEAVQGVNGDRLRKVQEASELPSRNGYIAYHKSIQAELDATKNRIRDLIGNQHWSTDGEHKETILRKVLRSRLPETCRVGTGFVCFRNGPSTQQDILITSSSKPTLYKDGDLTLVTPDTVLAMIEVKTSLETRSDFLRVFEKLGEQVARVRKSQENGNSKANPTEKCWAGVYVYDFPRTSRSGGRSSDYLSEKASVVLNAIKEAAQENEDRVINCVAVGPNLFIRYWGKSENLFDWHEKPGWSVYNFKREQGSKSYSKHNGLAPAYFIGNLIVDITSENSMEARYAWFPIQDSGGKEQYKTDWISLIRKKA